MIFCAASLSSCSGFIKSTAKEVWDEHGTIIVRDAASAAKKYWDENQDKIIAETIAKSSKYLDDKLSEQRNKVVQKYLDKGYKISDIDANGDNVVTDDELENFVKSNPKALWVGGGALALWWSLWQARRRMTASKVANSAVAS